MVNMKKYARKKRYASLAIPFLLFTFCYTIFYFAKYEHPIQKDEIFAHAKSFCAEEKSPTKTTPISFVLNNFPGRETTKIPSYLPLRQNEFQVEVPVFAQLNAQYFAMGNIYENIWYSYTYYC